jgi:hypothetical protein
MIRKILSLYILLVLAAGIGSQAHANKITIHNCSPDGIRVCLYNTSEKIIEVPYRSNHIGSGSSYSFSCQPDSKAKHCASVMLVRRNAACNGGYYYRNLGHVDHYFYNNSMSIRAPLKCP